MTNKYLAIFAEQTASLEAAQQSSMTQTLNSSIDEYTQLAEAACQTLAIDITPEAQRCYGLLVASASTDSVSAMSGAELAATIITLVTAYYNGNKEALQPAVDAASLWIAAKHDNEVKTANLPNNLRLLVDRKSKEYAIDNELENKLILSVVDGLVSIKEKAVKPVKLKSKAQKVFETVTGLDAIDRDELVQLMATDGQLMQLFAAVLAPQLQTAPKQEKPSKEAVDQLKARLEAAVIKEDRLMDESDHAEQDRNDAISKLEKAREDLAEQERQLTNQRQVLEAAAIKAKHARKPKSIEAAEDQSAVEQEKMEELLEDNVSLTNTVNSLAKKAEAAIKAHVVAEDAYNAQAALVAQLSKQSNAVMH